MLDSTNGNMHFIQMPSGTPAGFPMAQFFGEEWSEFDVPLAESFVTDLDTALVKPLLDITLAAKPDTGAVLAKKLSGK